VFFRLVKGLAYADPRGHVKVENAKVASLARVVFVFTHSLTKAELLTLPRKTKMPTYRLAHFAFTVIPLGFYILSKPLYLQGL
jgi:uncharacterized membrane protein